MTEVKCYPCHMGNHSGTNGTTGCDGGECRCSCRTSVTFHGITAYAAPGSACWSPEKGWHNA